MALPLPKVIADVGPGGGIVTSMGGQNAVTRSALDNITAGAQAQYAPWNSYADASLKMAQAQTAPANALATFLSSPAAGTLSRDQQIALGNLMQNYLGRINFNNLPPPPNQGGNLLQKLFGSNQNPNVQGFTMPNTQGAQNNYLNQPPQPQQPPQQPQPQTVNTTVPQMPATQTAASNIQPGSSPITPTVAAGVIQKGLETGVTNEAANMSSEWKDNYDQAKAAASGAQLTLQNVDKLETAYKEMNRFQKGKLGGNLPSMSNARDDFEAAQAAIASSIARASQEGHINPGDMENALSQKPSPTMKKEAFQHQIDFMRGMNNRIMEHQAFDLAAATQAHLTPQQADIVWNYYNRQRPFMDFKNHKYLGENLNTWEDFLTPQKIQEAYSPKMQKAAIADMEKRNPSIEVWIPMIKTDGREVEVRSSSVDEALKAKYRFKNGAGNK